MRAELDLDATCLQLGPLRRCCLASNRPRTFRCVGTQSLATAVKALGSVESFLRRKFQMVRLNSVNHEPKSTPVVGRLGILNDYVRIPYANGSSFASQFLYREFRRRGSEVTIIGPKDPKIAEADLPPNHVMFASLPLRNHPGVYLPMPNREGLRSLVEARLDLVVAQTGSALMNAGLWLRRNHGVPLVCVNTIHLPSVYDVLLPEALHNHKASHEIFQKRVVPWVEQRSVDVYNGGDALVVFVRRPEVVLARAWCDGANCGHPA